MCLPSLHEAAHSSSSYIGIMLVFLVLLSHAWACNKVEDSELEWALFNKDK